MSITANNVPIISCFSSIKKYLFLGIKILSIISAIIFIFSLLRHGDNLSNAGYQIGVRFSVYLVLKGDSNLENMLRSLRETFFTTSGASISRNEIGIDTSKDISQRGKIKIVNETQLKKVLED